MTVIASHFFSFGRFSQKRRYYVHNCKKLKAKHFSRFSLRQNILFVSERDDNHADGDIV